MLPGGKLPASLLGVPLQPWDDAPKHAAGWEELAQQNQIEEPNFKSQEGLAAAAGVLVKEADGRIWLVAPTNQFGGYELTFPKGRQDGKSLQATALCEAYEESGLHVRLLRHLVDVRRSQTFTRYYLGERLGGSPADMGWESQCVILVPVPKLGALNLKAPDRAVVQALNTCCRMPKKKPGARPG